MKHFIFICLALFITWFALPVAAQDMRALSMEAQTAKKALLDKIAAEKADAQKAAQQSRLQIKKDRAALEKAIADLEAKTKILTTTRDELTQTLEDLDTTEKEITEELAQTDAMINELVGVIRIQAKDMDALMARNPRNKDGDSGTFLKAITQNTRFPGMADIRKMVTLLYEQTRLAEEIVLEKGAIVDRTGRQTRADILFLGPFTTAYQTENETGFLNYSHAGGQLFALSHLPSGRVQKRLSRYMAGQTDTITMDITQGAALRQLVHELSLLDQVPKGGAIVWPILAILVVGIGIVIERIIFLSRKRVDADSLINRIDRMAMDKDWEACTDVCLAQPEKPVSRVLMAGLKYCEKQREEMENALQEAILKEIPPMERFLASLGMLAAIAPLLGLLGTVTGMIDTFHVITLYGTGDPRLMSGGISEALVTTMLGLSVAIPLMLSQTLLNRAVDRRVGEMEEKAVSLVNIVDKCRGAA